MWFTEFFLCIDIERHFCNIRATLINRKIFAPNLYSKLVLILFESSINDINSHAVLLENALNNYFKELEEIPTEDILNEDDIIRLIQEKCVMKLMMMLKKKN